MNLNLDNPKLLTNKNKGITLNIANYYFEAAVLCLQNQKHNSPKEGKISGNWEGTMNVSWKQREQENLETAWDIVDATEQGAVAIALSLTAYKNYKILERSQRRLTGGKKRSGFDYWLEDTNSKNLPGLKNKIRLEISGILQGTESQIHRRVEEKLNQVGVSDYLNIGAIILVVEFSNLKVRVCQK